MSDEIEVIDLVDIEDLEDVKVGDEGFFEVLNGLLSREARRGLPIELQELSDKNASNGEKVINHLLKKKFSPLVDELRNMSAAELETYILVEQNRLDIAIKAENNELRQQLDKIGNEALRDGLFSKVRWLSRITISTNSHDGSTRRSSRTGRGDFPTSRRTAGRRASISSVSCMLTSARYRLPILISSAGMDSFSPCGNGAHGRGHERSSRLDLAMFSTWTY